MQNHIFRPIPSLDHQPQPQNKEERLKVIIANLEQHHRDVRASIIAEARDKMEATREQTIAIDAMDLGGGDHVPDYTQLEANLKGAYVGGGDPCLPNMPALSFTEQGARDPELSIAQETMKQLEAYDKHAKRVRDYYTKALERQRGQRSTSGQIMESRDPRRRSAA